MKKLITLVLTLALCVPMLLTTSIEVKASNKCAHEKCTVTETEGNIFSDGICYACSYGNQKYLTFKPYNGRNADEHSIITSKCLGCNTIITYSEGYMVGYCDISESNLVCSKCGREKEKCTHTSCANSSPEATSACNACSAEHIMEPNGVAENGHNKYVKKCAGCGFIFDADVVDDCDTNNNGACSVCGNVLGGVGTGTGTGDTSSESVSKSPTKEEIVEQRAEVISKEMEAKIKVEEAIPVTDFVTEGAVNAIPTEVKGNTSTDLVFNVSKITSTRGFVAAVDKIAKANPNNKAVTLYSDKPFAFNTTSLTAVADANKDFVYMFKHEGHLYKVTIPAGAKIDLSGATFAGPLYIGAQLGTTVVVK